MDDVLVLLRPTDIADSLVTVVAEAVVVVVVDDVEQTLPVSGLHFLADFSSLGEDLLPPKDDFLLVEDAVGAQKTIDLSR